MDTAQEPAYGRPLSSEVPIKPRPPVGSLTGGGCRTLQSSSTNRRSNDDDTGGGDRSQVDMVTRLTEVKSRSTDTAQDTMRMVRMTTEPASDPRCFGKLSSGKSQICFYL